jgi:hypothetical protein
MKKLLITLALILAPVAPFPGLGNVSAFAASPQAGLGDLSAMKTIVADVQALIVKGDMKAAAARITNFETAWDKSAHKLRARNSKDWTNVDEASDRALSAVRKSNPSQSDAKAAVASLINALNDPSQPAK